MYKKSLFLGAVVLALTVLLVLVGCSNPTSDASAAPQAMGPVDYPPGTVFTDDFVVLLGLLDNRYETDTNHVTYVAYSGAIADELTIPEGKTVYWQFTGGTTVLVDRIIVEPGAKLVLERSVQTADAARLLVKGTVEVYEELELGAGADPALQVADYYIEGTTITARGTVIGTPRVLVAPTGTLILTADDIALEPTVDRFTPAQAWAAAGQGSLTIAGPLDATYTVTDVLAGVYPSRTRIYTVETNGGDVLPAVIPAGAFITAHGLIKDAEGHNLTVNGVLIADNAASTFEDIVILTVNGGLIANTATFENVETLTVSGLNNDNLTSRASDTPTEAWVRSYLGADSANLKNAVNITIGDYGEFATESQAIQLPPGAKIRLGRSAIFTASANSLNSFNNLTSLFIGPASEVSIQSTELTFQSLETLTLQDSASLMTNPLASGITFLVEATPSTPPKKTEISFGLNAAYSVGMAPAAKVAVVITNDSSLRTGSELVLTEGSTLTVAAGKSFAIETGATLDIRSLGVSGTAVATAPATPADAPVQINGTIEFKGDNGGNGGQFIGLNPIPFTDPADVSKFAAFGPNGRLLFNYGAGYVFGQVVIGTTTHNEVPYIGVAGGGGDPFALAGTNAQVIIHGSGINIRATDGGTTVVDVEEDGAYILKEQTLFLDTGVELRPGAGRGVMFAGDTTNGGQLKGPGKLVIDYTGATTTYTTITGGSDGWQAASGNIAIINNGGGGLGTLIISFGGAAILKAGGPSAVITQSVGNGNALSIAADTTVDLGGTATSPGGSIVLQADTNPGELVFVAATSSKLLIGPGAGGAAVAAVNTNLAIGGKEIINGTTALVAADIVVLGNKLVGLSAATAGGSITAGTTPGIPPATNDVTIVSNAVFTNTN